MKYLYALVAIVGLLIVPGPLRAQDTTNGTWTLEPGANPESVHLTVRTDYRGTSAYNIPVARLGLTQRQLRSSGQNVGFTMSGDAGVLSLNGWIAASSGGGTFTFAPAASYGNTIRNLGFSDVTPEKQLIALEIDLSMDFARSIAVAGFSTMPFSQLIGFRALEITPQYAQSMREALPTIDGQSVMSLRALRVTPDYVLGLRSAGVTDLSARSVITLKALKIEPDFARRMAAAYGLHTLTVRQLIRLKVAVKP